MPSFRINRINEDVKKEISDILRSVKDPRVPEMLSIIKVSVSGDLSYAKVYISALEGYEASKQAVKGLKSASGYIRHELGSRLKLRKTPELTFIADDSIEHGMNIAKICEGFNK